MSYHKNPTYQIPELLQALKDHHLPTDTPSQLADAFRDGWMAAMRSAPKSKVEPVAWRYQNSRGQYRYRSYVKGFYSDYKMLSPIPLYTAPPLRDKSTCDWTHDADEGAWDTGCGRRFVLSDEGPPAAHGMKFCYSCGRTLSVKAAREKV